MLVISQRRAVLEFCRTLLGRRFDHIESWDGQRVRQHRTIIVDGASLLPSELRFLRVLTRLPDRPVVILIDGASLNRAELAFVSVDAFVPDTELDQLREAVEQMSIHSAVRQCGEPLVQIDHLAPRLRKALSILFMAAPPLSSVRALASASCVPERTLRDQWAKCFGSAVRLNVLLRSIKRCHRKDDMAGAAALGDLQAICSLLLAVMEEGRM